MIRLASQSEEADLAQFAPEVRRGLDQLAQAFRYAQELNCPLWEFAVEIGRLLALGMTTSDLRWLAKCGYLSHGREITAPQDTVRRFDPPDQNLAFAENTCFVLTGAGLAALELPSPASAAERPWRAAKPNWDSESRTFSVGEYLVKRFRVPSSNQEAVLEAFQEEGWPRSIDDPLPPVADQQPKRRLRDTIKCLNLNQAARLIRFRGDGTGQRVRWELVSETVSPADSREVQSLRRAA
jgi:hypothetical protein